MFFYRPPSLDFGFLNKVALCCEYYVCIKSNNFIWYQGGIAILYRCWTRTHGFRLSWARCAATGPPRIPTLARDDPCTTVQGHLPNTRQVQAAARGSDQCTPSYRSVTRKWFCKALFLNSSRRVDPGRFFRLYPSEKWVIPTRGRWWADVEDVAPPATPRWPSYPLLLSSLMVLYPRGQTVLGFCVWSFPRSF